MNNSGYKFEYLYIQDEQPKPRYDYCPNCGEKVEAEFNVIQNDWAYDCRNCGCTWIEKDKK